MKLRIKTHLIFGIVLITLATLAIASVRVIILGRFRTIEADIAANGAESAADLIKKEIDSISLMNTDWATWDETYEYAANPDEGYIVRNFDPISLSNIDAEIVSIFDSKRTPLADSGADPWNRRTAPVPQGWKEAIESHPAFFTPRDYSTAVSGLLFLPEYPLLVSAHQILTSERKGPSHGTLIMGRKIDDRRLAAWKKILKYPIEIYFADADNLPPDVKKAASLLTAKHPATAIALDDDRIAGYRLVSDITGKKNLIIRMEQPRSIYSQALNTMSYFVKTMIGLGFVVLLINVLLTERLVLKRLLRLNREVNAIASSQDASSTVDVSGDDEITTVSSSINKMLGALKSSQDELRETNTLLEKAHEAKNQLTSIVSHELRTPLGTIKQAIELIQEGVDGPISEKQKQRLDMGKRNVERLVRLTKDLLDFTRIEAGKVQMNYEKTDVNELMTDVYHLMKPAAEAKGIALILDLPEQHRDIVCDSDKIRQTVINLINNATKFTDSGGKITLKGEAIEAGVRIDVEDTGIGIKDMDVSMIFEPFRQIKDGRASSDGSGLGLSICKLLVEKHGGTIDVRSTYGEGSTFSITLPDRPPDAA